MCRSRRELSNEYLLAKIGVDTAENEPLEVWEKIQFTIHFTPYDLVREQRAGLDDEPAGADELERDFPPNHRTREILHEDHLGDL